MVISHQFSSYYHAIDCTGERVGSLRRWGAGVVQCHTTGLDVEDAGVEKLPSGSSTWGSFSFFPLPSASLPSTWSMRNEIAIRWRDFCCLANRSPQLIALASHTKPWEYRLHSVRRPEGPIRRSGVSAVPQDEHRNLPPRASRSCGSKG